MAYKRYKKVKTKKEPESERSKFQRKLLAIEILSTLSDNGFKRCERLETQYGDMSEIVYAKPLAGNPRYMVAVYTSCNQAGGTFIARAKGKDAIRVAGLVIKSDGKTAGVIKNTRVNRTNTSSEICKRMVERITKSFRELQINSNENCHCCGAPKFLSKKGNLVCSDLCFKSNMQLLQNRR